MEYEPVSRDLENCNYAKFRVTVVFANGDRMVRDFNERREAACAADFFDPAVSRLSGRIELHDRDDRRIMINPDHVVMVTDETVPRTGRFLEDYTIVKDEQTVPQEVMAPSESGRALAQSDDEDECQEHGVVVTPGLPSNTGLQSSENTEKHGCIGSLEEVLLNPDGTVNPDFLDIVRSDSEKGYTGAKVFYGTLCCEGRIPGMTAEDGLKYIREAVCAGDSFAMCEYGKMLLQGDHIEASPEEGARWIQRAAEKDDVEAMTILARLYRSGVGVEQSIDDCIYWLDRAADYGNLDSLIQLYSMYLLGNDVDVDENKAFDYVKKATDLGDLASEFILAGMYNGGMGTAESKDMALMHLRNIERKGFTAATQVIETIESEIESSKNRFQKRSESPAKIITRVYTGRPTSKRRPGCEY